MTKLERAIRAWTERHERTVAYIARQIGTAPNTLRNWMNGTVAPGGRLGMKLHRLTGIDLETIFDNQREKK